MAKSKNITTAQLEALKAHAGSMKRLARAIDHKLRFDLMVYIRDNEKLTVTDLYIKLRLEQSVASQHLAIMRRQGLVKTERVGKFIYYRLAEDLTDLVNDFAAIDNRQAAA